MKIEGLKEGEYTIELTRENVYISIKVWSGKYWDVSSDFIL